MSEAHDQGGELADGEVADGELAALDDRVIGRAFWISVVVLLGAAFTVAAAIWWPRAKQAPQMTVAPPAPPQQATPAAAPSAIPDLPFRDITTSAGIDFDRVNGAVGGKLLPETLGGGVGFVDVNNDGAPDLVFVDGDQWPGAAETLRRGRGVVIYLNDGKGNFSLPRQPTGLEAPFQGMGLAAGDYDGDGRTDLLITGVGAIHLYRNESENGVVKFTERTSEAGLADPGWSTVAAFFDADGDGRLDLIVGHYVVWSAEIDSKVDYRLTGIGRAYGPPLGFEGTQLTYWHNDGNGRFSDRTREAGLIVTNPATGGAVAKTLGFGIDDFNGDGSLDLFVANDRVANFLFVNNGKGGFKEVGVAAGVAFDRAGAATGAMGADVARLRSRDEIAIAVGNFANEPTSLYVDRKGAMTFSDDSLVEGVGAPSRTLLKFGVLFADADLDGRPDLVSSNGHLEERIASVQASQEYRQRAQLFWNAGPGASRCFVEVPASKLGALVTPVVGRGLACADIDGDGDLDFVITQPAGPPLLLRNEQATGHHWIRLKLVGKAPGAEAIGARVECESAGAVQVGVVMPSRSYLSSVELPLTFGLGGATKAACRIRWPDGSTQNVEPPIDQLTTIRQAP